MSLRLLGGLLTLTLSAGFAIPAMAQEVLPFPPKPSGSTAARTMQEINLQSAPAGEPSTEGCAEHSHRAH